MNNIETDKCNLCGLCKTDCPIYNHYLTESMSPRTKAMIEMKGLDKFKEKDLKEIFMNCTLCGSCLKKCPGKIDFNIRTIRGELINRGIETVEDKKIIDNIHRYGNPFGKMKKRSR